MGQRAICCALVWMAGSALAQTGPSRPAPAAAKQTTALDAIREYALNYTQRLPDYTCTQVTRRNRSSLVALRAQRTADTMEEQVSMVDHREIHTLTKINGNPVSNVERDKLSGGVSKGEFGSLLAVIFDPATATAFHFDRLATLNGRRMYVFAISVPQFRGYLLADSKHTVQAPYKGFVYADYQTKAVMRIEIKCIDIPANSEFRSLELTLDYKSARVAGQEFILPSHYLLQFGNAEFNATNEAEYQAYRRFSADATIKFDDDTQ